MAGSTSLHERPRGHDPADPDRTEEDEAEHELMVLVAFAMVAITAASAAVTYLLI